MDGQIEERCLTVCAILSHICDGTLLPPSDQRSKVTTSKKKTNIEDRLFLMCTKLKPVILKSSSQTALYKLKNKQTNK